MNARALRPIAHLASLAAAVLATAVLVGCGGDSGPERYDLSGKVTFKGQPVPFGSISLSPDTSKGNKGPGSFAQIRDGQYEVTKGTIGGPHVLSVTGLEELPGTSPLGEGPPPLFTGVRIEVDIPKEDTTRDIDVPTTAGQ